MKCLAKLIMPVVTGILLSSCAFQYKIADVEPQIRAVGHDTSVAVASLDKRPFIVDKSSPVTYVGMVRGGTGNPFDATTASGLPFADAVSKSICQALKKKGFYPTPVTVQFDINEEEAVHALLDQKKDKAILIIIRQWESDSFYNLNIGYDFILKVISSDGTVLATSQAKDAIDFSGSIITGSLSMSKEKVPLTFQKAIETLLNNQDVVAALADG